jgi:hypothetical protein
MNGALLFLAENSLEGTAAARAVQAFALRPPCELASQITEIHLRDHDPLYEEQARLAPPFLFYHSRLAGSIISSGRAEKLLI